MKVVRLIFLGIFISGCGYSIPEPRYNGEKENLVSSIYTDFTPIQADHLYTLLLKRIIKMSDEEISELAGEEMDYQALLENPNNYRGKFVYTSGIISDVDVMKMPKGYPLDEIYVGYFFTRNLEPVIFHIVEKPPVFYLREDEVELEGMFIKLIGQKSTNGKDVIAPLFLGKRISKK